MDVPGLAKQQGLYKDTECIERTCQKLWRLGMDGKRESENSMLSVQLDIMNILMLILVLVEWGLDLNIFTTTKHLI